METKQKTISFVAVLLALVGLMALPNGVWAGDLEPSSPPAPTMKTLDEVEPRIPISQTDIPLTINQSGSYYLTEDVNSDSNGIIVEVNDVTIDLMGYSLIGPGVGAGSYYIGILITEQSNVEIRNGTVRDFGYNGIREDNSNGKGHRVISVRVVSNGYGISLLGNGHLIKDCTAVDNFGIGIIVGYGSTVTGNTAYNNQSTGIYVNGYGCMVTGNTAYNNQSSGIAVVGYGSTVTGNTAHNNQLDGVWAFSGCTVTGNTAMNNNRGNNANNGGIRVGYGCLVKGNTLSSNLQNNIYVVYFNNAIEENLVTNSTNGIYFNLAGNFYANNRASNTTDYAGTLPVGGGDGGGNASF